VHKSEPTFAGQSYSSSAAPTSGSDLFKFTVSADANAPVELYQLGFTTSTTTMTAAGWKLYDTANSSNALNATAQQADGNGLVKITPDNVISIPAGSSKTFVLKAGTISGWGSGASISVKFATPTSTHAAGTTASSQAGSYTYTWSDRSATSHGTGTSDWYNGELLKDLVNGVYSYTANF
jgi:hypothetical protein